MLVYSISESPVVVLRRPTGYGALFHLRRGTSVETLVFGFDTVCSRCHTFFPHAFFLFLVKLS